MDRIKKKVDKSKNFISSKATDAAHAMSTAWPNFTPVSPNPGSQRGGVLVASEGSSKSNQVSASQVTWQAQTEASQSDHLESRLSTPQRESDQSIQQQNGDAPPHLESLKHTFVIYQEQQPSVGSQTLREPHIVLGHEIEDNKFLTRISILCCCCIGVVAACKNYIAKRALRSGNIVKAQRNAKEAASLARCGICTGIVFYIFLVIVGTILAAAAFYLATKCVTYGTQILETKEDVEALGDTDAKISILSKIFYFLN